VIFAAALQDSLEDRTTRAPAEFARGEDLGTVLDRHLRTVESMADTILLTSILLLDSEGKRLRHVAAPSLPQAYCQAIDGVEIGPTVGSCGTAVFLGRAIYVTDIAKDPLWVDYRDLALHHGLRACWSTPIRDTQDALLGSFAVYHRTPRSPTREEVGAIALITDHVAQAIEWARDTSEWCEIGADEVSRSPLRLAADNSGRESEAAPSADDLYRSIAADFESIARIMKGAIDDHADGPAGEFVEKLHRIKQAAEKGAKTVKGRRLRNR
jgi:GAF domain-containing protein